MMIITHDALDGSRNIDSNEWTKISSDQKTRNDFNDGQAMNPLIAAKY